MFQGRKARKILANLLVALILLTNPAVVPAVQAVNTAEQTAAEEQQTVTTQDSPSQSGTDIVYTVDKSANRQAAVQLATGVADGDGHLSNQPTTKDKVFRFGNSLLSYYLNQGKNHGPQWLKTTSLSFFVGEDFKPVYSFETIQPFGEVNDRASLWFWQGRYAHSGDASTANLGLGWRDLSADKHSMVGYNLFYDYGFQYNLARVGFGGEYFNKQAEYRFNVYHPVSGDRQTNVSYLDTGILYSYIRAVDGLDLEMGTSLPHAQWMKWYLKGYYYDNKHNDDELGYQLRTTMQLSPRFQLELGYRYSNLSHEPYATFQYQLADKPSLSAKDGKKTGDSNDLSYKLLQPVERDNDIKTETYTRLVAYTGSIRIRVTNSLNSTPIIGATLRAYQNGAAVASAVTTDAGGNALISGLSVGTYTVKVDYGSDTATSSPVTVIKDQTAAAAVSLAVQGGSARITVLNGQSQPVSGASVTATLSSTTVVRAEKSWIDRVLGVQTAYAAISSFNVTINADANGLADFTNLPPGTYIFTVSYNGHTMRSQGVEIATNGSSNITVILPSSGGNIQAVVKDGSGTAISGATVKVLSGATTVATGTTDSNGVAVIGGIAAGSYTISAAKTGYICNASPNVNVIEGQTASATVTMTSQTGSVTASVSFSDGATNVTPSFYVDGSATAYMNVTGSPATGYTLTGLTTNVAHTIKVSAVNYTSSTDSSALSVTPSSTGTVNAGSVTLTRETGSADITVTFSDGATSITPSFYVDEATTAATNVTVKTVPTSTTPGVYTISGLTTNTAHTVKVSATNYSSSTDISSISVTPNSPTTAATGSATLTRQTGNANITVYDDSGTISGAIVSVTVNGITLTVPTNSFGVATFSDIPTGSYSFTASKLGYSSVSSVSVNITNGNTATAAINLNMQTFTITATVTGGTGGTITPAGGSPIPTSGTTSVNYGSSQAYTITADSGHIISGIFIDGSSTSQTITATGLAGQQSYTFNSVIGAHTISATFAPAYAIAATAGTGGTISPSGSIVVTSGGSQTYTITADSSHIISGIFIDGSSTSQTITATGLAGQQNYSFSSVTGAHTISATFAPAYAITATAGTGGTISPSGSIVVTSGGSQTYTITADSSHIISGIFIDGSSTSQTITATGSGGSQQYVFSSVTSTHTIQATFTSNTLITLTTAHGSLLGGAQVYISDTNGHSTTTCISNTAGQVWIDTSAITGPATAHIVFSTYSGTMPVTTGPSANTVIIPMDVSCQVQPSIHPPSFIQITTGTYTITSTPATGFNFELPHNDSTQYNIRFSPGSYLAISTDPGDTNPLAVLTQGGTLSAYILLSYSSIYCATNYLTAY